MIVGSGLLATAMAPYFAEAEDYCVYAAGVSNSSCTDDQEFLRELRRVEDVLGRISPPVCLVYFGTCSVADPCAANTAYVRHKLAMEALIRARGNSVILRLPQVVGKTPNPHTLTNYLVARILRSERFTLWRNARRYLIHADDVAKIAHGFLVGEQVRDQTLNVSSPDAYPVAEIVGVLERQLGKPAVYDLVDSGGGYAIDTGRAEAVAVKTGIEFGPRYLEQILLRTYASFTGSGAGGPAGLLGRP